MPTPEECQKEVNELRKKIEDTLPSVTYDFSPVRSFAVNQVLKHRSARAQGEKHLFATDDLHKQAFVDGAEKALNLAITLGFEGKDKDERFSLTQELVNEIKHISFGALHLMIQSKTEPGKTVCEHLFLHLLTMECIKEYDRQMALEPFIVDIDPRYKL